MTPSQNNVANYRTIWHEQVLFLPSNSSALHIAHALKATEVQRKYSKPHEQPIETYLDREEQVELEAKHKEEEDR